jgi:hypothetical protein
MSAFQSEMFVSGLGCVKTVPSKVGPESQEPQVSQATIAAINGLIPTMFITRVRL